MISLLITAFLLNGVLSHGPCGFDEARQRALDNDVDGSLHKRLAEMERHFESEKHKHRFNAMVRKGKDRRGLQDGVFDGLGFSTSDYFKGILEIPVVVHVLYNPNYQNYNLDDIITHERIQSQIMRLNKDYSANNVDTISGPAGFGSDKANYKMSFKLHKVIRKEVSWKEYNFGAGNKTHFDVSPVIDPKHYLNIYVVTEETDTDGNIVLGQCSWPGLLKDDDHGKYDGCTIHYQAFGDSSVKYWTNEWKKDLGLSQVNGYKDTHGRTTTHEIGHYLNLYHPWGNKQIDFQWVGDRTCGSDTVWDTPQTMGPHSGCPATNAAFNNHGYTHSCDGKKDQYMNHMDYSDGECRTMFTKGQLERSLSIMNQPYGKGRKELIDYQSRSEHLQKKRFVNDLYFIVTSETDTNKICGPSDEILIDFDNVNGVGRVVACASTTDNPYVDVMGYVSFQDFALRPFDSDCIAIPKAINTGNSKYICLSKFPFTDTSFGRRTIDTVRYDLRHYYFPDV